MKARIIVTLKTGVLDPQGKAIESALKSFGIDDVGSRATHEPVRSSNCRRIGHDFAGNRARGSLVSHHGPSICTCSLFVSFA